MIDLFAIVIKTARFAITEKTVDSVMTPPSSFRWGMRKSRSLRKVKNEYSGG
jgi:hypothetical protein